MSIHASAAPFRVVTQRHFSTESWSNACAGSLKLTLVQNVYFRLEGYVFALISLSVII